MSKDYWIQKWQEKDIRFHQQSYHPMLVKYGAKLSGGKILVPLCGKSLDMIYLASLGHGVVGVELSDIACREFFIENKLTFTEKKLSGFIVFESENITLYCGDFFELPQDIWKGISGIYDRAALVALPEDIRRKYASEIMKKSPKGTGNLLITFDYPDGALQGPPFSVPESELKSIFKGCEIQKLDSRKDSVRTIDIWESIYWMTIL